MQTSYGQPDPGPDAYKLKNQCGKTVEVAIITTGDGTQNLSATLKAVDENGVTLWWNAVYQYVPFHRIRHIYIKGL